jgi:ketol-acid reductoisomerase
MHSLSKINTSFFKKTFSKQIRNIHVLDTNGIKERIYEREDFPLNKCKDIIDNKTISIIGYGPQGRGQALNLRDNGFNVVLGLRDGKSKDLAVQDGWEIGKNIVDTTTACNQGDIIKYLVSDAAQIQLWDTIEPYLTPGKTLYFSHGLGVAYPEKTGIIPPRDIDVILVAPKGAGMTVRNKFLEGNGINSSYAVFQDATGNAKDTSLALAFGIGSGHVFETTFEKEVYSDLTGERCVLMGLIQGAFSAQYKVLRENGHSPSEAYNETVEEALISLYPLIADKGMDWLYDNCSTTAQRGALDWAPKFENVLKPVIEECYNSVKTGVEVENVIKSNSDPNYRINLKEELKDISEQELWQVAKNLRSLRC